MWIHRKQVYFFMLLLCQVICTVYCLFFGILHFVLGNINLVVDTLELKLVNITCITFTTLFLFHFVECCKTIFPPKKSGSQRTKLRTGLHHMLHSVGRNGVYFEIKMMVLKLIEIPLQSYQGLVMSQRVASIQLPTMFASIIITNCSYLAYFTWTKRRSHAKLQILLVDLVLDVIVGVFPICILWPRLMELLQNPGIVHHLSWTVDTVSSVQYLVVTDSIDLFSCLLPFMASYITITSLRNAIREMKSGNVMSIVPDRKMAAISLNKIDGQISQKTLYMRYLILVACVAWSGILIFVVGSALFSNSCQSKATQQSCQVYVIPWLSHFETCDCLLIRLDCSYQTEFIGATGNDISNALRMLYSNNAMSFKISHCPMRTVPPEVRQYTQLLVFTVFYCKMEKLEIDFRVYHRLMIINIKNRYFRDLPLAFRSIPPSATRLYMDHFPIKQLPGWIQDSWKNVKYLSISDSRLTEFPRQFSNSSISRIILEDNYLTEIPDYIVHLRKLKTLRVSNNNIVQVSTKLRELPNLKFVLLAMNNISNISRLPWTHNEIHHWTPFPDGLFVLDQNSICNAGSNLSSSVACRRNCVPKCDLLRTHNPVCNFDCNNTACAFDNGICINYYN